MILCKKADNNNVAFGRHFRGEMATTVCSTIHTQMLCLKVMKMVMRNMNTERNVQVCRYSSVVEKNVFLIVVNKWNFLLGLLAFDDIVVLSLWIKL